MHRRAFLAAGLTTAVAGCLTDSSDDGGGGDDSTGDDGSTGDDDSTGSGFVLGDVPDASASTLGLAPEEHTEDVAAPDVDVDALATYDQYDESVPLLPVDDAYDWYRRRDARFVDARSLTAFESDHVVGAEHSPAPDARRELPDDDPVSGWAQSERIVAYCGCPHHLSGQRASELRSQGYEAVYAIDEGFYEWRDRGYPTTGGSAAGLRRSVAGQLPATYGGQMVRVLDASSQQVEPDFVGEDGRFDVEFVFYDVTPEDPITLETPAGEVTGSIAELTSGTVTL